MFAPGDVTRAGLATFAFSDVNQVCLSTLWIMNVSLPPDSGRLRDQICPLVCKLTFDERVVVHRVARDARGARHMRLQ